MVFSRHFLANKTVNIIIRLSREMNNKKISCVAKNNEINAPKTRTVTVQMSCKWNLASITITTICIAILLIINITNNITNILLQCGPPL